MVIGATMIGMATDSDSNMPIVGEIRGTAHERS